MLKPLGIRDKPMDELNEFQRAVLELDDALESMINVNQFCIYLSEQEDVSAKTVRRWINGERQYNPSAVEIVKSATASVKSRGQLRKRISSNLVPISTFPDLEECVETLGFRRFYSLCQAVSEAVPVTISPHSIRQYKILNYGRIEVRECLEHWIEQAEAGEELGINPAYRKNGLKPRGRGPAKSSPKNMAFISEFPDFYDCAAKLGFRSFFIMCRALGEATGISERELRRYPEQKFGRIKVLRCLQDWNERHKRGESLEVNPDYRGVDRKKIGPIIHLLLGNGSQSSTYPTQRKLAEAVAHSTQLKWQTIQSRYISPKSRAMLVPMAVFDALKAQFKQYSSREQYCVGDALYNASAEDYGVVRSVDSKTMVVDWMALGTVTMGQNDKIDPY